MSDVHEYRLRNFIRAEKLETNQRVMTTNGAVNAKAGDYLVYGVNVCVVNGAEFENEYSLVEESVSESRKFSPVGKTVEDVLKFLREYPDEVDRVKEIEKAGASRKSILEY